ncbi:nucleolar protein 58 [Sphaeroforma arctica JP610]|uniref:Nucleolar protein 58 n=1 Tax=Sphaeroforma arctica JP610 TaxID=667725 RepID=A0A0L0GBN4_9EUKA|nr:nucleolar protein 58 [Sphaeroforma arctica JP610]KNC85653.1 nucleolar protein 58 [Sphaeroforma arctica JP610]|eukprot:XP_014159555.1 nucleolar protein 58 [Sphaeroforma arctica JP610]
MAVGRKYTHEYTYIHASAYHPPTYDMLVLFETPAGYALFKVLDEGVLKKPDDIWKSFETPEQATKTVKLHAFEKFEDTTQALAAATALVEGKMDKDLKGFLKKWVTKKGLSDEVGVFDPKLAGIIKDKLEIPCRTATETVINELMRGIRTQMDTLVTGTSEEAMKAMSLGLAHSLSRYKLKFSPDKVDTMIVQAISLLDDLDKELNTYSMRVREWYGWHFPEISRIIPDNLAFAKTIRKIRDRKNTSATDLEEFLPEEMIEEVKQAAEISMGTEVSTEDMDNIIYLCDQVISIGEYRTQLFDYLKARMNAIAPNLTCMVGELVGARLISHAGSLLNLAKYPASTVQILGAEKALFRALKTKSDTPKYGLIYHASLVGQCAPKNKGKISRVLAAKTSLSARVDALGDKDNVTIGLEARSKVEARLGQMEGRPMRVSGLAKGEAAAERIEAKEVKGFSTEGDSTVKQSKKRAAEEDSSEESKPSKKVKKEKKVKKAKKSSESEPVAVEETKVKKEKKIKKEKKSKKSKKE